MQNKKKSIELFAGSQSFSKVAKELGYETFTSDINALEGIDYVVDIMDFDVNQVPFIPNIIWASPDCSTFSCAAGRTHYDSKCLIPKTQKAQEALKQLEKTLEILFYFLALNPKLKYYVENPVGRMQWVLQAGTLFGIIPRIVTIDQCQYGREHQKRTHIFTNDMSWIPRKRCPGRPTCNHTENVKSIKKGKRSSLGNFDGLRYYQRAMIPKELILEILKSK